MKGLWRKFFVGSFVAYASMFGFAHGGDVKVGSIAGVTGPIAELIAPIVASRMMAAGVVNDQGGLYGSTKYRLLQFDSQCDAKAAIDAAGKAVNVERVVLVLGASCSGATKAMVEGVTIPAGVVSISDSATAPGLSGLKDGDNVFRVVPSDAYQGRAIAEQAIKLGYKDMAVSYANDDYNAGIAKVFMEAYESLGGEVTASGSHEPDKASYRSELATLARGGSKALALFAYYGSSGINIIKNSLEGGLFDKFLAADGTLDKSVIESIGAEALAGNIHITNAASDSDNVAYKLFARLAAEHGIDPAGPYVAHGFDASFLMALALEQAGSAERGKIAKALREVSGGGGEVIYPGEWKKAKKLIAAGKAINYEGATGSLDFDENGDVAGLYALHGVTKSGEFESKLLNE